MSQLTVNTTTAVIGQTILTFTVTPTPTTNWFLVNYDKNGNVIGEYPISAGVNSYNVGPLQGPNWIGLAPLKFQAVTGSVFSNTVTVLVQGNAPPPTGSNKGVLLITAGAIGLIAVFGLLSYVKRRNK